MCTPYPPGSPPPQNPPEEFEAFVAVAVGAGLVLFSVIALVTIAAAAILS